MTRFPRLLAAAPLLTALIAASLLGAPFAASAQPQAAPAGVQDFSFTSYSADYYLARDAQGHSTLRTVETFVAKFPKFDQNRGMIRAIPNDYDGVPLHTTVASVTDARGAPVHFEATDSGHFTELALGTDEYVHGTQSYVITYTQQNVVRAFSDTNDDELYWDTNGTGFSQPFGSVTARVHVDPGVVDFLTGNNACYRGAQGSTDTCAISQPTDDPAAPGGKLFTAQTSDIGANENLTVAIGFVEGTFVQVPADYAPSDNGYQDGGSPFAGSTPFGLDKTPWWSNLLAFLLLALSGLGSVFAIVQRFFFGKRGAKGRGIIVPQYSPPKDLNLLEAANLIGRVEAGLPAQLVSFAVRGNIRILDYPVTDGGADYTLQLVRADGVDAQESRLLEILFGEELQPGAVQEVGVTNDSLAVRLKAVSTGAAASVAARGFKAKPRLRNGLITAAALLLFALVPTMAAAYGAAVILGIGFGAYQAVDFAMITQVLPAARDRGKDLGVINIANAMPQVLAPAFAAGVLAVGFGYRGLYILAAGVSVLGSVLVVRIRSLA